MHLDATVADIEEQNTYHSKPRAPAVKRRKTAAIKIDDVAAVRDAAAVTAQKAHPFNARNIYSTLVNPHGCAKEVLAQFATTVITKYSRQEAPKEVFRLLAEDFKYWQDIHFRSVPKEVTEKLRNVLMRSGSYFAVSHSRHIERCHREFEITTMSPLPPHTWRRRRRTKAFRFMRHGKQTSARTPSGRHSMGSLPATSNQLRSSCCRGNPRGVSYVWLRRHKPPQN